MRIYVPALFHELKDPVPPLRTSYRVIEDPSVNQEENEVREAQAVDEAAMDSLEILRDVDSPSMSQCGRLVLAVDIPESSQSGYADIHQPIESVDPMVYQWSDVAAFLADEVATRSIVQRVIASDTQDECDALIADLWDFPLAWYDGSERDDLARTWDADA